jgi:DNA (cytosine-5)-methyltransferase 1
MGSSRPLRFIDLFAGLGGFHLALRRLGHRCVFASEVDETLRDLYHVNFGMKAVGDIRGIDVADIPAHDILCAGFPCQPFSKAGSQDGFQYPELGGLYREMMRVIKHHRPRYLLLENVPNLERHGNGKTWDRIQKLLRKEGYAVSIKKLSPHHFRIPQIRERVYIVGCLNEMKRFVWPTPMLSGAPISIRDVLDKNPPEARRLPKQVRECIAVWQEFLDYLPGEERVPHPLWAMEFGATYPYDGTTPSSLTRVELRRYRGSFGQSLKDAQSRDELLSLLPSHARADISSFPDWKVNFIRKNREFYKRHKPWIDEWKKRLQQFPSSLQKLEWNCQTESSRDLRRYVLQVRPSGLRVKRPTTAPSLVAMTATQVPIITWEKRYMTPDECKRLQSMQELAHLPTSPTKAYEALGNAVNVRVAELVAEALVGRHEALRVRSRQPRHKGR